MTKVLIALALLAAVGAASYFVLQPGNEPRDAPPPISEQAPVTTGAEPQVEDAPRSPLTLPARAVPGDAQVSARSDRRARQMERLAAYNDIPVAERANRVAERWGLTDEQKRQVTEILSRYGEELAALELDDLTDAELASKQRGLFSAQMREIAPIVGDSPRLNDARQRFIEAAEARGGTLVTPQTQR
ncbi:MAG: hypothetical protein AAGI11_14200 [Pseudomonadota bacterium]